MAKDCNHVVNINNNIVCVYRKSGFEGSDLHRCVSMIFLVISGFADAAIDPIDFPTAPAFAIPKVSNVPLSSYVYGQSSLISVCTVCHSICIVWRLSSTVKPIGQNFIFYDMVFLSRKKNNNIVSFQVR